MFGNRNSSRSTAETLDTVAEPSVDSNRRTPVNLRGEGSGGLRVNSIFNGWRFEDIWLDK